MFDVGNKNKREMTSCFLMLYFFIHSSSFFFFFNRASMTTPWDSSVEPSRNAFRHWSQTRASSFRITLEASESSAEPRSSPGPTPDAMRQSKRQVGHYGCTALKVHRVRARESGGGGGGRRAGGGGGRRVGGMRGATRLCVGVCACKCGLSKVIGKKQ